HYWPLSAKLGDFEVPESGRLPPIDFSPAHWFDHHLKGIQNDIDKIPAVTYYVMGPFDGSPSSGNIWRTSDKWPVPAVEKSFYFAQGAKLLEHPVAKKTALSYQYHPHDPSPTIGGRNLFLESGPKDQRPIEGRKDVLVFTSEPLIEDIEVTGRIL